MVRYVPRVEREEFINVGLLMMCKRRRWLRSDFCLDERRIKAFDPGADVDCLKLQLSMFDPSGKTLADYTAEERFRWMSAVKSSVIQTSRPHPGLIDCAEGDDAVRLLDETFERLFGDLIVTPAY